MGDTAPKDEERDADHMADQLMRNDRKKSRRVALALAMAIATAASSMTVTGCMGNGKRVLPEPTPAEGLRGELGIDANIDEGAIDEYLGRDDAVYRDVRMLHDPANYEAIEGDSYLSGYVDGFEVVPYPYLAPVKGLPDAVGAPYDGPTLFSVNEDGAYVANYEESMRIVSDLFPRDKIIFLMCGGGGYAGMTKQLLVGLGYDETKIYDVGGYWYYDGEHGIDVKRTVDGKDTYDFHLVPYHTIDFSVLHPTNGYTPQADSGEQVLDDGVDIASIRGANMSQLEDVAALDALIDGKNTFVLYAYLPGCSSCASFTPIIDEFATTRQVPIYQISYELIKGTDNMVAPLVKYTPTVVIFRDGQIVDMLSPTEDDDLDHYKTLESFSSWLAQQIDVTVVTSDTINELVGCEKNCEA